MSTKFALRTLRQVVSPDHPYLAHLVPTRRCNLRCRFCSVPATRVPELDLPEMKRVVDRLDRIGIALLLITGGEPLLRPDLTDIVDHASARGLVVKVNSNGTMPRQRYARLLASGVSEIGISLDGVTGRDLPHSHVGPEILDSIRFLHDNLPEGKRLTIAVCVSRANRDQVEAIVAHCSREFPRAGVFLNPVVVGSGSFRSSTQEKVNPDFLRTVRSPALNIPEFYVRACEDYYRNQTYHWACLAGQLFFAVQPNGDVWICQDQPSRRPLNILAPDFEREFRRIDLGPRDICAGCTFSCYVVTQGAIEPRHWRDLGVMWWNANTREGDGCRETARRYGWMAGALHLAASRLGARVRRRACRAGRGGAARCFCLRLWGGSSNIKRLSGYPPALRPRQSRLRLFSRLAHSMRDRRAEWMVHSGELSYSRPPRPARAASTPGAGVRADGSQTVRR